LRFFVQKVRTKMKINEKKKKKKKMFTFATILGRYYIVYDIGTIGR